MKNEIRTKFCLDYVYVSNTDEALRLITDFIYEIKSNINGEDNIKVVEYLYDLLEEINSDPYWEERQEYWDVIFYSEAGCDFLQNELTKLQKKYLEEFIRDELEARGAMNDVHPWDIKLLKKINQENKNNLSVEEQKIKLAKAKTL